MEEDVEDKWFKFDDLNLLVFIPQFSAFILSLTVVYAMVWLHAFYELGFHIPIFQFIDISEIFFFAPGAVLANLFILLGFTVIAYIIKNKSLTKSLKVAVIVIVFLSMITSMFIEIGNDPRITSEFYEPSYFSLWGILILYMFLSRIESFNSLVKKIKYVLPFLLIIGLALIDAYRQYIYYDKSKVNLTVKLKLKDNSTINKKSQLFFIGRTKNYWFFYNPKLKITRTIKDEDVKTSEFFSN
jgi:hypothetical protein